MSSLTAEIRWGNLVILQLQRSILTLGDLVEEKSETEPCPRLADSSRSDQDDNQRSPSRTSRSSRKPRRSRSRSAEKGRKLKSGVAKVVGKKPSRNPFSESRRYSSTSYRTESTSTSSSSRKRKIPRHLPEWRQGKRVQGPMARDNAVCDNFSILQLLIFILLFYH